MMCSIMTCSSALNDKLDPAVPFELVVVVEEQSLTFIIVYDKRSSEPNVEQDELKLGLKWSLRSLLALVSTKCSVIVL